MDILCSAYLDIRPDSRAAPGASRLVDRRLFFLIFIYEVRPGNVHACSFEMEGTKVCSLMSGWAHVVVVDP